jgi:hypothetical protein
LLSRLDPIASRTTSSFLTWPGEVASVITTPERRERAIIRWNWGKEIQGDAPVS